MKILIVDDERSADFAISIAMERSRAFTDDVMMFARGDNTRYNLVRSFEEAKWILESDEEYDYLLLDHDLGSIPDIYDDGTRLMNILEEKVYRTGILNPKCVVAISSNPSGVSKINGIFKTILERHGKNSQ